MITSFFTDVGKSLANKVGDLLFSPAPGFWAAGLAAWLLVHGEAGWTRLEAWVVARPPRMQTLLLVGAIVLLLGSAGLMQSLATPLLRLLEGYWPHWRLLARPHQYLVGHMTRRQEKLLERYHATAEDERTRQGSQQALARSRRAALEVRLRRFPADPTDVMPTRLGNVLRAAETQPRHRYGLDPVATWSAFWLVLPETTQKALAQARDRVDRRAAAVGWAALLVAWVPIVWLALPAAIGAAVVIYRTMLLAAAGRYADLLVASFDVHRFALYQAMRIPPPDRLSDESKHGELLTFLIWRGWMPELEQVELDPPRAAGD